MLLDVLHNPNQDIQRPTLMPSRFYLSPVTGHLFVEVQEALPAIGELAITTGPTME